MTREEVTTNELTKAATNTTNERKRKTARGREATANHKNGHAEEAPAKPAKKLKVTNTGGQTAPKHAAPHDRPIAEKASEEATGASGLPMKRRSQYPVGDAADAEGSAQKLKKLKVLPVAEEKRGPPLRRTGM